MMMRRTMNAHWLAIWKRGVWLLVWSFRFVFFVCLDLGRLYSMLCCGCRCRSAGLLVAVAAAVAARVCNSLNGNAIMVFVQLICARWVTTVRNVRLHMAWWWPTGLMGRIRVIYSGALVCWLLKWITCCLLPTTKNITHNHNQNAMMRVTEGIYAKFSEAGVCAICAIRTRLFCINLPTAIKAVWAQWGVEHVVVIVVVGVVELQADISINPKFSIICGVYPSLQICIHARKSIHFDNTGWRTAQLKWLVWSAPAFAQESRACSGRDMQNDDDDVAVSASHVLSLSHLTSLQSAVDVAVCVSACLCLHVGLYAARVRYSRVWPPRGVYHQSI